jgi:uncharacterized protein YndB with AHSA1/START domain
MENITATAEIDLDVPVATVWAALTDPARIKQYMFGSEVETTWTPGSPIVWKGEYEGKPYEDKGEVVVFEPEHRLVVTHFSPMSGQPDSPENYHTLTYLLTDTAGGSHLSLSQDGNSSAEEAEHSTANWSMMLNALKSVAEG